jgi:4-amino-4-deoxy-L-arabinose transferase-like glycosyltransferase
VIRSRLLGDPQGSSSVACHAGFGAGLAFALALLPRDLSAALAVLVVLALPVALWLGTRGPDAGARTLMWIFLAAVGVRAGVSILVEYGVSFGFFALDDHRYATLGFELARFWAGEGPYPNDLHGPIGYYVWNALIYTAVGFVPLAPALANAVMGGLAVVLAHSLARDLAGPRAALYAALLAAFWPSLVLWSSLNLKDPMAILAILLLLRGAQRMHRGPSLLAFAQGALGFLILSQLREYLALLSVFAVGLAWLLPRLKASPLVACALLLVAALLLPSLGPVQELVEENSLESLDQVRRQLAIGGSAYHGDVDVSSPGGALRFLPTGLVYFLLAPAPWQLFNARQLLTLPEMLVWYALLPRVVAGFAIALRRRFAAALPIATFAVFATLSYALVEGNLGTAYRHRAQVLVLFLIFGAVGLARRGEARGDDASFAFEDVAVLSVVASPMGGAVRAARREVSASTAPGRAHP